MFTICNVVSYSFRVSYAIITIFRATIPDIRSAVIFITSSLPIFLSALTILLNAASSRCTNASKVLYAGSSELKLLQAMH